MIFTHKLKAHVLSKHICQMAELELLPFDPWASTLIMVQDLKQAIARFVPPPGYVHWLPDDSKSPLYTYGVCVVKEGSHGKEGYFVCMLGKCIEIKEDWGQGKKLVISTSTSNAISHLRQYCRGAVRKDDE